MTAGLTERGRERLICEALTGDPCEPALWLRRRRLVARL